MKCHHCVTIVLAGVMIFVKVCHLHLISLRFEWFYSCPYSSWFMGWFSNFPQSWIHESQSSGIHVSDAVNIAPCTCLWTASYSDHLCMFSFPSSTTLFQHDSPPREPSGHCEGSRFPETLHKHHDCGWVYHLWEKPNWEWLDTWSAKKRSV